MLDAKLLKPRSLMETETAYRARWLSGLSRNGPQVIFTMRIKTYFHVNIFEVRVVNSRLSRDPLSFVG